ncbi:MAG: tetratricopeptide repeat protein [Azospirillaceae bacterium]|nr:tetratricopeptide repeat protein [Azospirillaceae bacterium]
MTRSSPQRAAVSDADIARIFGDALAVHHAGDLPAAVRLYHGIIALRPATHEAHSNLGIALLGLGQAEAARIAFRNVAALIPDSAPTFQALAAVAQARGEIRAAIGLLWRAQVLSPQDAVASYRLAHALRSDQRSRDALIAFRRAIALAPDFAEAHGGLGVAYCETGASDRAIAACRRAIVLRPGVAENFGNLGNALKLQGLTAPATAAFRRAIVLRPDQAVSYNNLGSLLRELGALESAWDTYRQAVLIAPDFPEALSNLGVVDCDRGDDAAAIAACRRAIACRPAYAEAHNNLGNALEASGQWAAATTAYRRALRLEPAFPEACNNLGTVLRARGLIDEAVACYEQAIARRDAPDFHLNYAMALLHRGKFERGWTEYEWRWKIRQYQNQYGAFAQPEWRGEPLEGRTILFHGEQGFGDCLQFVRYVPLLAARGARVVLRVRPPLIRLLRTVPGVATVVSLDDAPPPFDCHLALMSAPRIFGTTVDTIPTPIPYLRTDAVATARWRARLAALPGRKIGLVWSGDPHPDDRGFSRADRRRSLALDRFVPLAAIPDLTLVSLQKGAAAGQRHKLAHRLPLVDWMDEIEDFADTAALIAALDLVITVDTAVAHLAGGLGQPVWILSRFDGCWRWLHDTDRSPWYPQARLYRQATPGAWDGVIDAVRGDLARFPAAAPAATGAR